MVCWGAATAGAGDPDFEFLGPAPARNFQPIQLIFLDLPFERAATIGWRQVALRVESAESNVIATTQGQIRSTLKFETNRTVLGARYGVGERWEVGIDQPLISRFGGFLDPFIDDVEGLFGAGNRERDLFPNNSFGAFIVARGDTILFHGGRQTLRPGDLSLSVKRQVSSGERWPLVAVRAALKIPTGSEDAVVGSGEPDLGVGVAAEKRALPRCMLYLNLNLVYPMGRVTPAELTLDPIFTESFAAEFAFARRWSGLLHQAVYTSPLHGTGVRLLDGTPVEIGLGANFSWSPQVGFQLLAINNVSPVEPAADFSLLFAMTLRTANEDIRPPLWDLPPLSDQNLPAP